MATTLVLCLHDVWVYTLSITIPSLGSLWMTPAALVEEKTRVFLNAVVSQVANLAELEVFIIFHITYLYPIQHLQNKMKYPVQ